MIDNPADYYNKHPVLKERILKFFKTEHGFRPRATLLLKDPYTGESFPFERSRNGGRKYIDDGFRYQNLDKQYSRLYGYPMTDISRDNVDIELNNARTLYFFSYIFDDDGRKAKSIRSMRTGKHIIGFTPVIDVDTPKDIFNKRVRGRDNQPVLEIFNSIRLRIKEYLSEVGLWDDTRLIWSGNGYYAILPDFYGSKEDIMSYNDAFVRMKKSINVDIYSEYKDTQPLFVSSPMLDERYGLSVEFNKRRWNLYYKIPYSFHAKYDDMSFPIGKEVDMRKSIDHNVNDKSWRCIL